MGKGRLAAMAVSALVLALAFPALATAVTPAKVVNRQQAAPAWQSANSIGQHYVKGSATGRIVRASDGRGLSGIRVRLEMRGYCPTHGWEGTSSSRVVYTTSTGSFPGLSVGRVTLTPNAWNGRYQRYVTVSCGKSVTSVRTRLRPDFGSFVTFTAYESSSYDLPVHK